MTERLIDVTDRFGNVQHTFPVSLNDQSNPEDYHKKALLAATFAHVAPDKKLQPLRAKDHISRSGPLEPGSDPLPASAETKPALEQDIRERAYFLWEGDGRPEVRSEYYWHCAKHKHRQERAYLLWQKKGCREGYADEDWAEVRWFEEQ
jgi:hypothetical protein